MTTKVPSAPKAENAATASTTLLRDLASAFTREPKNLRVEGAQRGANIIMSLQTDADDHPRLVGSQGKHILAMQTLFAIAGHNQGIKTTLTLLEPWGGTKQPVQPFQQNPDWQPDDTEQLMRRVLDATMPVPYTLEHIALGGLSTFEITPLATAGNMTKAIPMIQEALHLLFHAAGKTQGRTIHVTLGSGSPNA